MPDAHDHPKAEPPGPLLRAFDWMFRSRETGDVVIIQPLNIALGIFVVAAVIRRFAGLEGPPATAVEVIAFVSLMWWAIDEVIRGVNPFRRLLGAAVGVSTLVGAAVKLGWFA